MKKFKKTKNSNPKQKARDKIEKGEKLVSHMRLGLNDSSPPSCIIVKRSFLHSCNPHPFSNLVG
jgi:hypothetical protein